MDTLARFGTILATAAALIGCGDSQRMPNRTDRPLLPGNALERVADLDYPPGNIAVAGDGRIYFTMHPDGDPPANVFEWRDNEAQPWPNDRFQQPSGALPHFRSVLSLRIDRQNRLWTLDHANYATDGAKILAFDLDTRQLVHHYDFQGGTVEFLSMLNDFQVDASGRLVYIADTSPIRHEPGLIVYDSAARRARRLLVDHPSLQAEDYVIQAPGRDMVLFGLYTLKIPVDSITLSHTGDWLYYGPLSGSRLYRIATKHLIDPHMSAGELERYVEDFGPKPISDGITIDRQGRIYFTDIENSAIVRRETDGRLQTLIRDARLRWPDGLSWGPDGWLYVTCSSLHDVILQSSSHMESRAPYQIFRFQPGATGVPGH